MLAGIIDQYVDAGIHVVQAADGVVCCFVARHWFVFLLIVNYPNN